MMFEKKLSEAKKAINPVCCVVGTDEGSNPVALRSFLFGCFHILSFDWVILLLFPKRHGERRRSYTPVLRRSGVVLV